MYFVYILQSLITNKYYIGQTSDIDDRIKRHNDGRVKSTKNFRPWKLVHIEELNDRSDSCKRELEIKNYKGGILFKRLLGLWKD